MDQLLREIFELNKQEQFTELKNITILKKDKQIIKNEINIFDIKIMKNTF